MADTWTLILDDPDRYGREQVRTVKLAIDDIRNFKDKAVFPWLLMAANPDMSLRDIQAVLSNLGPEHERPLGWLSRRRWMIHGKGKRGAKPNADGQDGRARHVMAANPNRSTRQLVWLLREEYGIRRGAEWVRENRTAR
jgi:hypothetical protein